MSHFAKVANGIVTQVIVAEPEFFNTFVDSTPGDWIQTSYNTKAGKHTAGGTPLRGNYAGLGYTYDTAKDVFYAPSPFTSWKLNETSWTWEAPVAMPTDGKVYAWDEASVNWKEVVPA